MSIASRIESINEHLEDAYDSLENIGVDLTGINKNISNLSAQIESVYTDLPKIKETDTNIILNNTKKGKMELNLKGNMYQFTTTGKNVLPYIVENTTSTQNEITITAKDKGTIWLKGTSTAATNFYLNLNGNYTIQENDYLHLLNNSSVAGCEFYGYDNNGSYLNIYAALNATNKIIDLTNQTGSILKMLRFFIPSGATINMKITPMILNNISTQTDYEPYTGGIASPNPEYPQNIEIVTGENTITITNNDNSQSQSYPINLGNLELCKIENNQDYIYENNNHWYLHKEIGKIILNGSENWQPNGTGTYTSRYSVGENTLEVLALLKDQTSGYCKNNKWITSGVSNDAQVIGKVGGTLYYRINTNIANTTANFKTYLASNNAICYTVLKTNTENEITDITLINQLNTLKLNCKSYNTQTNISQINNNTPFIITASALLQNNS